MKRIKEYISSNLRQILEIIILVTVAAIPFFVNLHDLFKSYLDSTPLSPDNIPWYIALSHGDLVASIILCCPMLYVIRKFNQGFLMNGENVYHDYCYCWYWFCSKILGIKKCNLVLVPIFMQFKLVIRGTFEEYPLTDDEYPIVDNEPDCKVEIINKDASNNEINFILEDTYLVDFKQIPKSKQELLTIKVSRNDGKTNVRHFSKKFIETIINELRKLKESMTINVYATTNPKNTVHVAKRAFALGNRGNVKQLYVFQQKGSGRRKFEDRGHKIY